MGTARCGMHTHYHELALWPWRGRVEGSHRGAVAGVRLQLLFFDVLIVQRQQQQQRLQQRARH